MICNKKIRITLIIIKCWRVLQVSIYGRSPSEWDALSAWVVDHKLWSSNVRWMIQIPRLYSVYKANKIIGNLQDMLDSTQRISAFFRSSLSLHVFSHNE